jgi:flagellar basal-body rod modification protein FlgD
MEVNAISNAAALQAATRSTGAAASGNEKNMFMTLLVAQLKNQDPLQPQDGTAFVAQLAQFNSLDQLMAIRESIDALNIKLTPTTPTKKQATA